MTEALEPATTSRIGITDVTREFGIEAVRGRIAHLHTSGQHYAARAIEQELSAIGACRHPATPGSRKVLRGKDAPQVA
ncbi:hypothetical protein [Nocardia mexicana]|uniref:Uncharacterized protein n=1 Tax=Nocardia mexicana TaxID=279262 RepID=A0A370H271_9NOCA|nr:hypothetical protein [Nocardia mexicana]RDI50106.1 hypothetical protein DFR68_106545 [Nocardia mexicana]